MTWNLSLWWILRNIDTIREVNTENIKHVLRNSSLTSVQLISSYIIDYTNKFDLK